MKLLKRRRAQRKRIGLAPGSLLEEDTPEPEPFTMEWYRYSPESLESGYALSVDEIPEEHARRVTWINIDGIPPKAELEKLGRRYGIHALALEDIQHVGQRPKLEDHDNYLFAVFAMLWNQDGEINDEQVSLLLLPRGVISIQERQGDIFNSLRSRLENSRGRLRRMGSDYLAYAILDLVVDHYLPVVEHLEDRIQAMETRTLEGEGSMDEVHSLRQYVIALRRRISPMREVLAQLRKSDSPMLSDELSVYFGDLQDHGLHVLDTLDALRDQLSSVVDLQMSAVSNNMNRVMKTLTIVAAIFIPLTFLAGIYGMNFAFMPELELKYGYPIVLGIMATIGVGMVLYFRRKKWM